MVRAMYGVQLADRKRAKNLMLMLTLRETLDQLAMANIMCQYSNVSRMVISFEIS